MIGAWLLVALALAPLQGPLQDEAADESDTFLVRGSESAEANRVIDERFRRGSEMAAVIAYFRDGGITSQDRDRINADAVAICRSAAIPSLTLVGTPYGLPCGATDPLDLSVGGPGLLTSSDGSVALASALMTDDSTPTAEAAVNAIRAVVPRPEGDETGLHAFVTGEAGFEGDRSEAVKGIDDTLLLVTCSVLLVLLLAIYRSPLVAVVPLLVVAVAYLVAGGITYGLVAAGLTDVSGQTTAILIVLMFGAGTDYCLLIVARFRDELRRTADVGEAMSRATRRTGPAILSAGAIVVVAMLVLALADFNATREMGPILALGVAVMVAAGLTLLPAILATLGRRAFWPAVPRVEPAAAVAHALAMQSGGALRTEYGFALGVSSLIFTHVMDQPASDPSLPVFTFIFLVALGVDYNVFLLARIREERSGRNTASAVTTALERTGGVITSAGLVLAATFSVLMALPLEALFQVGFVVALGLLADTFLVRALLVPSLAVLLGERNWWPQELLSSGSTEALDKPTKAA